MKKIILACLTLTLAYSAFAAPGTPEITVSTSGKDLTVSWNHIPGAAGYRLYYTPYPYEGPGAINNLDVGARTSVAFRLWSEAAYYVAVTAYDESGESSYSDAGLFSMVPQADPAPGAPVLSLMTSGQNVTVSWDEVPGATHYTLHYAPYPFNGTETVGSINMGNLTGGVYTLPEDAAYYTTTSATSPSGESGYSNVELILLGESVPEWRDDDGDGVAVGQGDCNDDNKLIYPGAEEVCGDEIDQNCSAGADEGCYATFTDNGDGTLTQSKSHLIWQQVHLDPAQIGRTEVNWHSGTDYCEDSTLAGYTDWRLPTLSELESIVDPRNDPTIDPLFIGTEPTYYWSSTEVSDYTVNDVHFGTGKTGKRPKQSTSNIVRCVR